MLFCVSIGSISQGLSPDDLVKLDMLFQSFNEQVRQAASSDKQNQVEAKAKELQAELSKGEAASGDRLNKIVDALLEMVPGAVSAIGTMFASPILGALVGPATKLVLDHLKK